MEILTQGIPTKLPPLLPRDTSVPHAPKRTPKLTLDEKKLAIRNALRYFHKDLHQQLAQEFADELHAYGHIYMYRFRPSYRMKARPITEYPCKCVGAACIMLMIQNNLDPDVAQFPHELVTYGGNGSVFSNWAQYLVTMKYLSELTEEQTLCMYSGHPLGVFPSDRSNARLVITNGLVVPNYSTREDYDRMYALGNTIYGQMTAGSYCYIGSQGIVHGTTITVLNAGRKYLGLEDLSGKVFVSSGLGGMSGAQAKAGLICGCVCVVAEVSEAALNKRHKQGWVKIRCENLDDCIQQIKKYRILKEPISIAYLGNVVDLWERLGKEEEMLVELASDQTSLHNPFNGGYYPVQLTFDEANKLMSEDPEKFKELVRGSLVRQVAAINKLTKRGMKFWDYGNSFLLEAGRAGADIFIDESKTRFMYPSYVEDIMGDIFSLGFGPFRWVCLSGLDEDLDVTDRLAAEMIEEISRDPSTKPSQKQQYKDNYLWIKKAKENQLVVGSKARILYSDAKGRIKLALAFNESVKKGELKGPVVLSRDHHDVSGADSPWRETANITDGSNKTADMATQTFVGNAMRGATWVALHNGGGTGWGEAQNCGFGLVLDGTSEAAEKAKRMLWWDVMNGIARRAWAANQNAEDTLATALNETPNLKVTVGHQASAPVLDDLKF